MLIYENKMSIYVIWHNVSIKKKQNLEVGVEFIDKIISYTNQNQYCEII